jgi:hypothetical protein
MISREPQAADVIDTSFKGGVKRLQENRYVRFDILEFVGTAVDNNDSDRQDIWILLERQIAIDCYKRIEISRGQAQKLAVLNAGETSLMCCNNVMLREGATQAGGNALVEKDIHEAFADGIISPLTSSSNCNTWDSVTVGKSWRNSLNGSPPSM